MSKRKWGESFLKTGLPLEHLAVMSFNAIGWHCNLHNEYMRQNREGEEVWFEIDIVAYSPMDKNDNLSFLAECKYHDESRFWFFLPCVTISHLSQFEALSAGEDLETNERVFHYAPFQALLEPELHSALKLAPKSLWGTVVSADGKKQDNTIKTAINQLAYGFINHSLDSYFSLHTNWATALVPMIITNAKIFRLRPDVTDLGIIRQASTPDEIADELPWTWCYFSPDNALMYRNLSLIYDNPEIKMLEQYPEIDNQLTQLYTSPSWIAVVNIDALPDAVTAIYQHLLSLDKSYQYSTTLKKIVREHNERRRREHLQTKSKD